MIGGDQLVIDLLIVIAIVVFAIGMCLLPAVDLGQWLTVLRKRWWRCGRG